MVMPTVASMPTAAIPIPYRPANWKAMKIAPQMRSIGIATDSNPTARPVMMFVAGPVSDAAAIFRIGFPAV